MSIEYPEAVRRMEQDNAERGHCSSDDYEVYELLIDRNCLREDLAIAIEALDAVKNSQHNSIFRQGGNTGCYYEWNGKEWEPWYIARQALEKVRKLDSGEQQTLPLKK